MNLRIAAGMLLPVDLQVCTRCRLALPLECFSPDTRKRSGRTSGCRTCLAEAFQKRFVPKQWPDLRARFNQFIDKYPDPTTCWEWLGARSDVGYGYLWPGLKAHRVSYELSVGPIEPGLTLDHLCFNTWCVNPKHLEPVTLSENSRRARFRQEFLRRIAA